MFWLFLNFKLVNNLFQRRRRSSAFCPIWSTYSKLLPILINSMQHRCVENWHGMKFNEHSSIVSYIQHRSQTEVQLSLLRSKQDQRTGMEIIKGEIPRSVSLVFTQKWTWSDQSIRWEASSGPSGMSTFHLVYSVENDRLWIILEAATKLSKLLVKLPLSMLSLLHQQLIFSSPGWIISACINDAITFQHPD